MPEAARLFEHTPATVPVGPSWSGEVHGEVGAMHRALEQRLLAGSFDLAVVPLPVRPVDELIAYVSRVAGWLVLAGAATGVVGVLLTVLG